MDYTTFLDPTLPSGQSDRHRGPYDGLGKYNDVNTGPYTTFPNEPHVDAAFNAAVTELKALGATVITVNIPAFDIYSNTIGASRGHRHQPQRRRARDISTRSTPP